MFLQLPDLSILLTKPGWAPKVLSVGSAKLCKEYFVRKEKEGEVTNFKDEKELRSSNPTYSFKSNINSNHLLVLNMFSD